MVWGLFGCSQGVPRTKARRAPLKIYFARLGLRSSFGHAAAQRRRPDQLPQRVERFAMAKWGQGAQESILPSKWDGEYFRKFSTTVGNASPQSTFCVLPTKSARHPSHYTYGTRVAPRVKEKRQVLACSCPLGCQNKHQVREIFRPI